jgi:hypothetical protein
MHLTATVQQGGLTAGKAYGLSIESKALDGHGVNIGLSDQIANEQGRVVFDVELQMLQAVAGAGRPCEVKLWVRAGGTPESAPPVKATAQMTVEVG